VRVYGVLEADYPGILAFIGGVAIENIANSDAPYHNAEHTMMVTLVGQEILRGKHIREGGVTPRDWLHFIVSLLCHDIGYVRGVCLGDGNGRYLSNEQGDLVEIPAGSTDASMTPYHVSRSKLFVRERFARARLAHFDTLVIERNIEHTRFPVPEDETHADTANFPGWCAPLTSSASSPTSTTCARSRRCSPNSTKSGPTRNLATTPRPTCAPGIRNFSGLWSAPILGMRCVI
jgi:hypothetical protein